MNTCTEPKWSPSVGSPLRSDHTSHIRHIPQESHHLPQLLGGLTHRTQTAPPTLGWQLCGCAGPRAHSQVSPRERTGADRHEENPSAPSVRFLLPASRVILSDPHFPPQTDVPRGSGSVNGRAKSSSALLPKKGNVRAVSRPSKGEKSSGRPLGPCRIFLFGHH